MRRRDFIKVVAGSALTWPFAARAQQAERMRRIGVLIALASDDPQAHARFVAFVQGLQELGWTDGRNVRIDTRWATGDADRFRMVRAAVLRDPTIPQGIGQFGAIQAVAPSFGVELRPIDVHDAPEIERAVTAFAQSADRGLIVTGSSLTAVHRDLIIALAARNKLPAVYWERFFVAGGGLISYGADSIDAHRRAAGCVDRILKGEKPADLPVQMPTKYETVVNLKTSKALGLTIPQSILATAEIIE